MVQLLVLGIYFVFLGIVRLCGSTLCVRARIKEMLSRNPQQKRRYLLIDGITLVLLGAVWCGLGCAFQLLEEAVRLTCLVIASGAALIIMFVNNKKQLGHWS